MRYRNAPSFGSLFADQSARSRSSHPSDRLQYRLAILRGHQPFGQLLADGAPELRELSAPTGSRGHVLLNVEKVLPIGRPQKVAGYVCLEP